MAVRTTVEAVQALLREPYWTTNFDQFITAASAVIDNLCLAYGYSDAMLELLERWLAAHLYSTNDSTSGELKRREVDTAAEEYHKGTSLRTPFSEQLKFFDPRGCLQFIPTVDIGVTWLGKPDASTPDAAV